jgi:hypothetical protein
MFTIESTFDEKESINITKKSHFTVGLLYSFNLNST